MDEMKQYKCPNCGGALSFDSVTQKVKCPYCDSEFEISEFVDQPDSMADEVAETPASEDPVWDTEAGSQWDSNEEESMKVYACKTCGGEIFATETVAAMKCPYCNNPIVFTGQLSGTLKPDIIIPFKLNKKKAKEQLMNHLKDKALLPKVFKDQNHIDEIKGIYVPFWLFDGEADGEATFQATSVRSWEDRDFTYTETSHYRVYRSGDMAFEKIPVDGSKDMPDALMESIEPYDYSEAIDFKTAYLAGYLADKYDVTAEQSKERAEERIGNSVQACLRNSVSGYNTITTEQSRFQLHNSTAKYALLPVWILNTSWNGEKYTFAMNGQTGKFVGNLPMDESLYWKHFGLTALVSSAFMLVLMALISSLM